MIWGNYIASVFTWGQNSYNGCVDATQVNRYGISIGARWIIILLNTVREYDVVYWLSAFVADYNNHHRIAVTIPVRIRVFFGQPC